MAASALSITFVGSHGGREASKSRSTTSFGGHRFLRRSCSLRVAFWACSQVCYEGKNDSHFQPPPDRSETTTGLLSRLQHPLTAELLGRKNARCGSGTS